MVCGYPRIALDTRSVNRSLTSRFQGLLPQKRFARRPPESGSLRERLQRLVNIVSHKKGEQLEIHTLGNAESKSNFLGWSVGAGVPQRVAWQGNDSRPVLMIRTHDAAEISRCSANGVRSAMAWGRASSPYSTSICFFCALPQTPVALGWRDYQKALTPEII